MQSPLPFTVQRSGGTPHACPWGHGRPVLPHHVGVGWCWTNGVRQLCHQQVRMRWTPENVPEGSRLSGSCCGGSGWFSITYGPGTFYTVGSLLGLRVSGLHSFKSRFSVPYSSVVPWTYFLLILETSHFGGSFFFSGVRPNVWHSPFSPQGGILYFVYLFTPAGHRTSRGSRVRLSLCLLLVLVHLYFWLWSHCLCSPWVLFGEQLFHM